LAVVIFSTRPATIKDLNLEVSASNDKRALQRLTARNAQQLTPRKNIHNHVSIGFLDLPSQDVDTETKLEKTILYHLQKVLMERGRLNTSYRRNNK
jgi:predicted nuclease of restriction endonuclease-like (RecB) superfamily